MPINNITVYVVESGCRFEGGGVNAIFSNLELARKYAQSLVQKENKHLIEANENGFDFELYHEESPNTWLTSTDYIRIKTFKLDAQTL